MTYVKTYIHWKRVFQTRMGFIPIQSAIYFRVQKVLYFIRHLQIYQKNNIRRRWAWPTFEVNLMILYAEYTETPYLVWCRYIGFIITDLTRLVILGMNIFTLRGLSRLLMPVTFPQSQYTLSNHFRWLKSIKTEENR